jgi:hypothetical protein
VLLHEPPPLVEYCKVPPEPVTEPMAMEPPLTVQPVLHVLLVRSRVPVGAAGCVVLLVMETEAVAVQPLVSVTVTV